MELDTRSLNRTKDRSADVDIAGPELSARERKRMSLQEISDLADETLSHMSSTIHRLMPGDDIRGAVIGGTGLTERSFRDLDRKIEEIEEVSVNTDLAYDKDVLRCCRNRDSIAVVVNPKTGLEEEVPLLDISGAAEEFTNPRTFYRYRAAISHVARRTIQEFAVMIDTAEKDQRMDLADPYWHAKLTQFQNALKLIVDYPPDHAATFEERRERGTSNPKLDRRDRDIARQDRFDNKHKRATVEIVTADPEFRNRLIVEMYNDITYRRETHDVNDFLAMQAAGLTNRRQPSGPLNDMLVANSELCMAAVAVNLLTGCRPAELMKGVEVSRIGKEWAFRITGAKVNNDPRPGKGKGQEWREIKYKHDDSVVEFGLLEKMLLGDVGTREDIDPPEPISLEYVAKEAGFESPAYAAKEISRWFSRRSKAVRQDMLVKYKVLQRDVARNADLDGEYDTLPEAIKLMNDGLDVSPYTMRHATSSFLKDAIRQGQMDSLDASRALGHQSERMKGQYGRSNQAGKGVRPKVISVDAASPVRVLKSYPRTPRPTK